MKSLTAISMRDVMAQTTLQLSLIHVRRTRLRLWLGAQVIKFAARVIGCDIEISTPR